MNILILPSWYPDEANPINGIFFREQALALSRHGLNVFVLDFQIYGLSKICYYLKLKQKRRYYLDGPIRTLSVRCLNPFPRLPRLAMLFGAKRLRHAYCEFQRLSGVSFDLVHIHSALNAGILYSLSGIKTPYVLTEHSSLYSRGLIPNGIKTMIPLVLNSADKIFAVGNGLKKALGAFSNNDVEVLYNVVSMGNYQLIHEERGRFRFFSLGLNAYIKGFDILLNAFGQVLPECDCELHIAGLNDDEKTRLSRFMSSEKVRARISLSGKLSRQEVANEMANCDCFVLLSRFETFGVVFAEAMFFGKPVIATATGGPDSFVTPETGVIVPVGDIEATASAMKQMCLHSRKYSTEAIKKYAMDNFSEKAICQRLLDAYSRILKGNGEKNASSGNRHLANAKR